MELCHQAAVVVMNEFIDDLPTYRAALAYGGPSAVLEKPPYTAAPQTCWPQGHDALRRWSPAALEVGCGDARVTKD